MPDVIKRTSVIVQYNADLKNLEAGDRKARAKVSGFAKYAKQAATVGIGLIGADVFLSAAQNISGLIQRSAQLALQNEQTRISFETMLGGAEAATKTLGELRKFAEETPLGEAQIFGAGQALLGFGVSADQLTDKLRQVSDISAGTGKNFNELAIIFGKARVQGTLFGEDINQLTNAGIPVIEEFAKQLGVSTSEVKKLASEGKISFANLEKAFDSMTGAGGRFYGLTINQSKTVSGRISTLKDTFDKLLLTIGNAFLPALGKLVGAFQSAATGAEKLINFLFRIDTTTQSATEKTKELQLAFNSEIEVLKKVSKENQLRGDLIEEINKKYGEYLPNLLTEKSTIEDIEKAQKLANDAFAEKLLLIAYEETINELIAKQTDLVKSRAKLEIEAARASEKAAKNQEQSDNRYLDLLNNKSAALTAIGDMNAQEAERLRAEQAEFEAYFAAQAERMGTTLEAIRKRFNRTFGGESQDGAPKAIQDTKTRLELLGAEVAKAKDQLEQLAGNANTPEFEDAAKNLANLQRQYNAWNQDIQDAVEGVYSLEEALKFIDGEWDKFIDNIDGRQTAPVQGPGPEIMRQFEEQQLEAQQRINFALESDRETQLRRIREYYDELLTEARKFNLGKEQEDRIRAARDKELRQAEWADAKQQAIGLLNQTFDVFSQISGQQAQRIEEGIQLQRDKVDKFKELAERGSAEQLQIEEDRLLKLETAKRKAQQRQQALAQAQIIVNQALAASNSIAFISEQFALGGPAGIITGTLAAASLALTVGSIISTLTSAFDSLPAFAEGIERVKGPGGRKDDRILARLSRDERVVSADINDRMRGIPNKLLPTAVDALYSMPMIFGTLRKIEAQGATLEGIREDMDKLIRVTGAQHMFLEVSERGMYAGTSRGRRIVDRERAMA